MSPRAPARLLLAVALLAGHGRAAEPGPAEGDGRIAVTGVALPEGKARWRFEIGGEHVGVVSLAVSCLGPVCDAVWESGLRSPAEAGGRHSRRTVEVQVDREGRWQGGRLRVTEDGQALRSGGIRGAVPASLAEILLLGAVPLPPRKKWQGPPPRGPDHCLDVFEEAGGARREACAHRDGDLVAAVVRGVTERIEPARDGFPGTVHVPDHGARFVRDLEATVPRLPPRLHGVEVPGPPNPASAGMFCGVERDPDPEADGLAFLPPPSAPGESCREKTAAWLALAARAGARGRTAVGVAWDGGRYVWHAWAEVRTTRGWIPVDPSFEQLPARGPRFTVATWDPGDEGARLAAGDAILGCWGREWVRER